MDLQIRRRDIGANGITLHIAEAGQGPLVLLCHGWPGSFVEYRHLIPLLTEDFHVVVPSPPGFGFSTPLSSTRTMADSGSRR